MSIGDNRILLCIHPERRPYIQRPCPPVPFEEHTPYSQRPASRRSRSRACLYTLVRCPVIKVEFSPERVALSPIVRTTRSLDVSDSPAAAASSAAAGPPGPAGAPAAAEQGNSISIINIDNIKDTPFGVPSDRSGDHTNWIVTDFRPPLRSSETL